MIQLIIGYFIIVYILFKLGKWTRKHFNTEPKSNAVQDELNRIKNKAREDYYNEHGRFPKQETD